MSVCLLNDINETAASNDSCLFIIKPNVTKNILRAPEDAIFFAHPEEMLIPWVINEYFFPIIVTYIITFVIGVTGNVIVIVVLLRNRAASNATSIFLVSLAVADLLLLVICAPLDVAHYFVISWDTQGTICKLTAYAETLSAFASVFNLSAVTLERFVVIVFPIRSRSLCTVSNCKKLMVGVWILSLLLAAPMVAVNNMEKTIVSNYRITVTLFLCKDLRDWRGFVIAVYRFSALFAIPSVLMIVCYSWVIIELWISTKTMDELTNTFRESSSQQRFVVSRNSQSPNHGNKKLILRSHVSADIQDVKRARQQVIKMLILIVILFLVCWGPRLILDIIKKCCLDVYNHGTYTIRFIFYLLPFVHSCLNPIVYCFMSTKFRKKMLRYFHRTCRRTTIFSSCYPNNKLNCRQPRLKSVTSRNEVTHISSTYTFTSLASSMTFSPTGDVSLRNHDYATITL
ncbi:cholecystokinin receptor type A-like [Centruroides sculpturatus]|uniref:cholecystokinin receptor type A-like n=1 Tax=Centruroides sculpturatus TaxID=218467 RepID=UPI000C6C96F4|nr:cholecystokinin receptor type A-like [Centruroides sculpturatus]